MVGGSCCTASFANVCLGDEDLIMEMDHLTLAEYRLHPESSYPAAFGGRVPFAGEDSASVVTPPVDPADLGFISVGVQELDSTSDSSGYSNISRTSYEMLEK